MLRLANERRQLTVFRKAASRSASSPALLLFFNRPSAYLATNSGDFDDAFPVALFRLMYSRQACSSRISNIICARLMRAHLIQGSTEACISPECLLHEICVLCMHFEQSLHIGFRFLPIAFQHTFRNLGSVRLTTSFSPVTILSTLPFPTFLT